MLTFQEYQALVEQAPIMVWRARTDKKCDYFNERWLSFRGKTLAEEHGDGWVSGVHAEDMDRCVKTYVEAFDRQEIFEMYYRLQRADGAYRWIFDRGVPFYADDGSFAGYIGSCIDVTERIEAEQELQRRQDAELKRVSKLLPVCAWCKKIRDDDGYWREVDEYLTTQRQQLTHCMCVDCASRMMGQMKLGAEEPGKDSIISLRIG